MTGAIWLPVFGAVVGCWRSAPCNRGPVVVKFRRHNGNGRKAENPRARGHASNWLPTRKRDLLEARISSCVANPVAASFPRSFPRWTRSRGSWLQAEFDWPELWVPLRRHFWSRVCRCLLKGREEGLCGKNQHMGPSNRSQNLAPQFTTQELTQTIQIFSFRAS